MANGLGEYFGQQGVMEAGLSQAQPSPAAGVDWNPTRTSVRTPPQGLPQVPGATGEYFAQNGMGYFGQSGMGAVNLGPVPGDRKPWTVRPAAAGGSPFAGALG